MGTHKMQGLMIPQYFIYGKWLKSDKIIADTIQILES